MVKENFTLTEDMKFGEAHAIAILAYSIMFVVGLTTNTISLVRMMQVRSVIRAAKESSVFSITVALRIYANHTL